LSKKYNILIVDDEPFVLRALKRVLHANNLNILTTINPQEAIEILKSHNIAILISDQRMPIMTGLELFTYAKEISPDTKRILISGFSDHKSPEEFINYGEIISYISKPWVDEEVKLLISSTLEMKELEEKNKTLLGSIKKQNIELENANTLLTTNIKSKRKQIQFVQNLIETSKLQLKTINEFLYIINSSDSIKDTFTSLFSTIYKIISFEEIGAVYSSYIYTKQDNFQILNVMKNERAMVRDMPISQLKIIMNSLINESKMHVIQNFQRSKYYESLKDCFVNPDTKQVIILPLINRDMEKRQKMGFIFLGSQKTNFFQSSKLGLFTELLTVLTNTISEMIVFERIKEGGKQWEETFDAIQDPLILINNQFIILRANQAAFKLSRTYVKNLIGKKCFRVFARSKKQCENCPLHFETSLGNFVDRSNNRFFSVKAFPIADNFLLYYKDSTDKRHLQYKLIQSDKMAAIGELAGQVAHEINNPLAGLLAYTQLLLKEINKKSYFYKYMNDLKEIETAGLRCKDIVENLLSFSTTHKKTDFISVDINRVIERTLPLAGYILKINKITIKKEYAKKLPPVNGNFNQLQQVFFNLLTNACHSMTGGGYLTIKTSVSKSNVLVSFQDTGSGIAKYSLKQIFDPFYTTKEENTGTGLGLYICNEIINNHSGSIKVDSVLSEGTMFKILLPIDKSKPETKKQAKVAEKNKSAGRN